MMMVVGAGAVESGDATVTPAPAPLPVAQELDKHGLPPRVKNGRPNPDHYREKYALVNDLMLSALKNGDKIPFNYESAIGGIDKEAKAAGFDPKALQETRTPEQVIADAVSRLLDAPASVWELLDDEIDAVEKAMLQADNMCGEIITDRIDEEEDKTLGKDWRRRLARIKRLRDRARNRIPALNGYGKKPLREDRPHYESAWVLRLMVYVGRSNMADLANAAPSKSVYMIGRHHAEMAVAYWEAKEGVHYGVPEGSDSPFVEIMRGAIEYKGCFLACPPGHGKTEVGRMIEASRFAENPKRQLLINHAQSKEAEKNLGYLRSLFELDNPAGRRFYSLFGLKLKQGNQQKFELELPVKLRQPSGWAGGVKAKVSGANASDQWWDDPVDQKEAEQETERKRTFDLLNGTWLTRMRGDGFVLATFTPWHHDDAMMRFVDLARNGKAMYRVKIQKTGGPRDSVPFKPVWPEMYPARKLREIYDRMRNPSLFSAAYMMNPKPEEMRIVKRLRLYDPMSPEHGQFLDNCVKYLSLDPAATRGERSDRAGVLYAGCGAVAIEKLVDGKPVHGVEKRVRILDFEAISATQADLVNYTVNLCRARPVDYVMVETRSGYVGTAEMFENYHGVDVRRLDPKNRSKEERLRAAAPALEDGNSEVGFRAVVEFPGVYNDAGILVLNERFKQLADEILDFGACPTDHGVDALTQLVIDLSPELGIGTGGSVSRQITIGDRTHGDHRLAAMLKQFEKPKDTNHLNEENRWIVDNWRRPKETWQ